MTRNAIQYILFVPCFAMNLRHPHHVQTTLVRDGGTTQCVREDAVLCCESVLDYYCTGVG